MQLAADEHKMESVAVENAFNKLMKWLYKQSSFSAESMGKKAVKEFIKVHANALNVAVDSVITTVPIDEVSAQMLRDSNHIFSGFKTLHELKESWPAITDEAGVKKPFKQFLNDVQTVNETYNRNYLQAEYNFVSAGAQMASKWMAWENDEDADRYLLQYRTAGDDRVREDHAELAGITLPMSSPFWDEYYPPNGWNCRCTCVQVRKEKSEESDETDALQRGANATNGKYQDMMRFNPGKTKSCWPTHNTYTTSSCTECTKNGMTLAKVPDNELCAACPYIRKK